MSPRADEAGMREAYRWPVHPLSPRHPPGHSLVGSQYAALYQSSCCCCFCMAFWNAAIISTALTVKPQKTPRENSAIEEGTELSFNELANRPIALLFNGKESFQLFRNDRIQHCRFRIPRTIRNADSHEGVASSKHARSSTRNTLNNMGGQRLDRSASTAISL